MKFAEIFTALKLDPDFEISNAFKLHSYYSVSSLATSSVAAVGCAISELLEVTGMRASSSSVKVDQTLSSFWFAQSICPVQWSMPPVWDAIAGDYRTNDGWIKLHTNLDHHKAAALSVLDCKASRAKVELAVRKWTSDDLEGQIVEAGGVAAAMRSREEWLEHPQGIAVGKEPLISWQASRKRAMRQWHATSSRPLNGLKVLDLTRVLAGPVCTRTLAGFGADVLRIDPPLWEEPNVVPDISLGKRCARLDLKSKHGREVFEGLLASADMLVHGYRADALEKLGYGLEARQQIAPNLIEISLDAYGWTGPWATRRGFDSLVQMSCGIAHQGMKWVKSEVPTPLPVQALDHATGYLMAAAAIKALVDARTKNEIDNARLSLARTAELLISEPSTGIEPSAKSEPSAQYKPSAQSEPAAEHYSEFEEQTPWGPALRLKPALAVENAPMHWALPACNLGSSSPEW